ncbi:MAG: hypothetical protein G01um101416_389 [Microgenomates group bacterium Gr01-1014_16]|nr:MAG: hypothetical protein G01um101416_389 [Microgenomates group bacterium Gr01-1014_16]
MSAFTTSIRPRRQVTFSQELLTQLGAGVGDRLLIETRGQEAVIKAQKQITLQAFDEIKKVFRQSGVGEAELQKSVRS